MIHRILNMYECALLHIETQTRYEGIDCVWWKENDHKNMGNAKNIFI